MSSLSVAIGGNSGELRGGDGGGGGGGGKNTTGCCDEEALIKKVSYSNHGRMNHLLECVERRRSLLPGSFCRRRLGKRPRMLRLGLVVRAVGHIIVLCFALRSRLGLLKRRRLALGFLLDVGGERGNEVCIIVVTRLRRKAVGINVVIGPFVDTFSMVLVSLSPRLPCVSTRPTYILRLLGNNIAISVMKRNEMTNVPTSATISSYALLPCLPCSLRPK